MIKTKKGMCRGIHMLLKKDTCSVFMAAVFMLTQWQVNMFIYRGMSKLWYTHIMEYCETKY